MRVVSAEEFDFGESIDTMTEIYKEYREGEGVPVHIQFNVKNINDLETGDWKRTGQQGAIVNNYGMEGISDLQLHELEPAGETNELRHLHDQLVYVLEGSGLTTVGHKENEMTFEWGPGSFFYLPMNAPYKFINTSDDESAKLMCHTKLPQLLQVVRDIDFVFNNDADLWEPTEGYYSADAETSMRSGREYGHLGTFLWDANFIPDLQSFDNLEVLDASVWGVGKVAKFPFFGSNLVAHMTEFPSGTYKKAHFHAPAYNILILYGEGYELTWPHSSDVAIRFDYEPGSIITPPAGWWHHHFQTAEGSTGQLAMHSPEIGSLLSRRQSFFNPQGEANNTEYVDEDPVIRETYQEELERKGIKFRMPPEVYEDRDFDLNEYYEEHDVFDQ